MLRLKNGKIPDYNYLMAVKKPIPVRCIRMKEPFQVETPEGTLTGKSGDYLLIGIKGEMYPCNREIFEETYEIIKNERKQ